MATAEQLGAFNSAVASGDFTGAAAMAAAAGYSPADVATYVNANAAGLGLGPETGFQGVSAADVAGLYPGGGGGTTTTTGGGQDYVDQQAVDMLSQFDRAIDSGDFVGASNLINQAANIYGPETYAIMADYLNTQEAFSGLRGDVGGAIYTPENVKYFAETISDIGVDAIPAFYVDPQAYGILTQFDNLMAAGDFSSAALLLDRAAAIYGEDATLQSIAEYLNINPRFEDLRNAVGGKKYTSGNIKEFITSVKNPTKPIVLPVPTGTPTQRLTSIPRQQTQTPSMLTFAPLRRGLAQLRPAAFMPGLLEGRPGFGGSGFTPESLREANATLTPVDRAYLMDVGGVSAAELAAATGIPMGQLQAEYNQNRPRGLFSSVSPQTGPTFKDTSQLGAFNSAIARGDLATGAQIAQAAGFSPSEVESYINANLTGLNLTQPIAPGGIGSLYGPNVPPPQNFALQTGAYGATIPTSVAIPPPSSSTAPQPGSTFDEQMSYLANTYLGRQLTAPEMAIYRTDFGGTLNQANISDFLNRSQQEMSNRLLVGTNPDAVTNNPLDNPAVMDAVSNLASKAGGIREGGTIKMAEGGMPRLSAEEAGSTFDIADYIDEQGRLVGGFSRPVYDENRVITGYDYRPYERDVVFGRELREKEAAMRLTDEELEQMMVEMAMRQGRTGVSPTRGGLAGIEIGDPMLRRRLQYYSTVEQFRPRYAKGGLASVAQNLADKGRKGDSMLVHMTPDEVAGLQALAQQMGGSLTINPETGLPEANFFKKLLPMALGFALGPAGAGIFSSALGAGLAVGAGYTLATGSLQQGISAGLGAYGGSNLGTGLQAAGAEAATSAAASDAASSGLQVAGGAGGAAAEAAMVNPMAHPDFGGFVPDIGGPSTTSINLGGAASGPMSAELEPFMQGDPGVSPTFDSNKLLPVSQQRTAYGVSTAPPTPPTPGSALTGAERFLGDKATRDLAAERYAGATGSTLGTSAMQIVGGAAGQSAADAEQEMRAQQAALDREQEERKKRYRELFAQTLGQIPVRSAGGGLMKLAGGGMTYMEAGGTTGPTGTPRDVTGTGDGMSDSVPASIEGVQEARLADGEFVIPADVVADIGNGSSDAGSKKLYDMMDRIRKARHGTTEQPPEIQAERLMPA